MSISRPAIWMLALLVCLSLAACGGDDPATTTTAPTTVDEGERPVGDRDGGEPAEGDGGGGREDGAREGGRRERLLDAETQVRAAIEDFFTSGDPALVCERLATERLLADAYGGRGGCLAAQKQPGAAASSVELRDLFVGGSRATALVVPEGGPQDGIEVGVELVEDDGTWRLDALAADVPAGP